MKKLFKKIPIIYSLYWTIKRFYRKKRGVKALKTYISQHSSIKLVVGSESVYDKGWTPSDIDYLNMLSTKDWDSFFKPNSIEAILGEHVWEHLTLEEGSLAAKNCYKYLKPGGYLRVAVPDGFHINPNYIERVKVNGNSYGAKDHKVLYNYKTFSKIFETTGFQIKLLEYFDESGTFHKNEWSIDQGKIFRSREFDHRNSNNNLVYTSIIIDAIKPS